MDKRFLSMALLGVLFATACSGPGNQPVDSSAAANNPTAEVQASNAPAQAGSAAIDETAAPDCLGAESSPIGQSIADDYDSASYEQVLTWFCNGAEFEDILVALETEAQTGSTANEMLKMLADGLPWEEIWLLVGLTE